MQWTCSGCEFLKIRHIPDFEKSLAVFPLNCGIKVICFQVSQLFDYRHVKLLDLRLGFRRKAELHPRVD